MSHQRKEANKKMMLTVVAAAILFAAAFMIVASEDNTDEHVLGASTEYINDAGDLAALANFVNTGGDTTGIVYELTDNIDLSEYLTWAPIGNKDHRFKGTFDGKGYTITGLKINSPLVDNVGLFGYVDKGAIKNLILEDVDIVGHDYVGAVVGYFTSAGSSIVNCHVTGTVNGHIRVGGIVGNLAGTGSASISSVIGSSFIGKVIGKVGGIGTDEIGGIAGWATNSDIKECHVIGAVQGRNDVGGIVGRMGTTSHVMNSYFIGDVTGSEKVGGIAGDMNRENSGIKTTVEHCYAAGTVTGAINVGGIAGYLHNGKITDSVALNEVVAASGSNAGRIVGSVNPSPAVGTELKNNAAFSRMESGAVVFDASQKTGTGKNGMNIGSKEITTDGTLGGRFASPAWAIENGKLPGLVGFDGIEYLLATAIAEVMFDIIGDVEYTGVQLKPTVTGFGLTEGVDFEVEYGANVNVGIGTATVKGLGYYSETITLTFSIVAATTVMIDEEMFESIPAAEYNGTAHKPTVVPVELWGMLLLGTDYTVAYGTNTNKGKGTVTITGINNYEGIVELEFDITAADLLKEMFEDLPNAEYDRTAHEPTVVPVELWSVLVPGTDYTVAYGTNTDKGTGTVTISGINNYDGAVVLEFEILPMDISKVDFTVGNVTYTGDELEPTVTADGLTVTIDFTVAYSNNINAGDLAKATVTGNGNYTGSVDLFFTIDPMDIAAGMFDDIDSVVYTGKAAEPIVVPKDAALTFEIYESLSVIAGPATVTVIGTGNYSGEAILIFTILKRDITDEKFDAIDNMVHTGSVLEPQVTADGLIEGFDFTVEYSSNIDVGTATIKITGIDNCFGEAILTFEIVAEDITKFDFSVAETVEYTGHELMPKVMVDGLTEDVDFFVVYSFNINVGTGKISVVGMNDYGGTVLLEFEIIPMPLSKVVFDAIGNVTYTGSALEPAVTALGLVPGDDFTVIYSSNINAGVGIGKATVTGIENYTGSVELTFTIDPMHVSDVPFDTIGNETYTGSALKPVVTAYGLTEGDDFTVAYGENINAGFEAGKATVTGVGNYGGSVELKFTIDPKDMTNIEFAVSNATYTGSALEPAVTAPGLVAGDDFTVVYSSNINAGVSIGKATVTGSGNYAGSVELTFTIDPKALLDELQPIVGTFVYDGGQHKPVPVVNGLLSGEDYTISYGANINAGDNGGSVTIVGTGNYTGSMTEYFDISAKGLSESMFVKPSDVGYTGHAHNPAVTLTENGAGLVDGEDFDVSYGANTSVGTGTVIITGKGNFTGTVELTFAINGTALDESMFGIEGEFAYKGTQWMPAVNSGELVLGEDFDVSYGANINAGTGTVTVTGKNGYIGTVELTFVISPKGLSNELSIDGSGFVYNGKPWTPALVSGGLVENEDYTISYIGNINAGTATVTIVGINNYKGELNEEFEILKRQIAVTPTGGQSKPFGSDDPVLAYMVIGGFEGMTIGGALSREPGEDAGEYAITLGTLGGPNYDIAFTEGVVFTISEDPGPPVHGGSNASEGIDIGVAAGAGAMVGFIFLIACTMVYYGYRKP